MLCKQNKTASRVCSGLARIMVSPWTMPRSDDNLLLVRLEFRRLPLAHQHTRPTCFYDFSSRANAMAEWKSVSLERRNNYKLYIHNKRAFGSVMVTQGVHLCSTVEDKQYLFICSFSLLQIRLNVFFPRMPKTTEVTFFSIFWILIFDRNSQSEIQ